MTGLGLRASGLGLIVAIAACGPTAKFALTSSADNDRGAISAALAKRQLPAQPAPQNAAHQPRVFIATKQSIVAVDLGSGAVVWNVPAEAESRIAVGGDFVVAIEHHKLVARDQAKGSVRWSTALPGDFIGASADRDRAYASFRDGKTFRLVAFDGASGKELWHDDADGKLGAPVAQGGLVYAPYLAQWLTLVDGKTGSALARLRGVEDQISFVRATSTVAYFGSHRGVFVLDASASPGAKAPIPPQLDRASYGRDLYDPVQNAYTAADRARVLWTSDLHDGYAIHYFRYVFGFQPNGELRWAYQHPRIELVASDTTGAAIVAIAQNGELIALDPKTGALRGKRELQLGAPVIGATFDADGWSPSGAGEPTDTTATLVAIARDHDSRFDKVKELAVTALAKLPGAQPEKELLGVLGDARAPDKLKQTVAELLVQRKDPASLPVLTEQLATHDDFIAKTETQSLGPVARAISGLAGAKLEKPAVEAALAALQTHLDAPTTQLGDLVLVIDAMSAIGGGAERPALASHLLLYHADDELADQPVWAQAIVHALHERGGPAERELLRRVSLDPRTKPALHQVIADAIAND